MNKKKPYQTSDRRISESARLCQSKLAEQLLEAALKEGISVDKNAIAVGISPSTVMVNAAVEGLAKIDMIRYEDGILTNFVYIDSTETSLAPGFYAVTTVADFVRIGRIEIRGEYSQRGELVAASPGFAIATSLRVPLDVPPSVVTGLGLTQVPREPQPGIGTGIYYTKCSNGGWWCITLPPPPS